MTKFLSPEWVQQLDVLLGAAKICLPVNGLSQTIEDSRKPDGNTLCVQTEIDMDGKIVGYFVSIDKAGASATAGFADSPDIVFSQLYETAVAIANNTKDAHVAFLMGEIQVSGDVTKLFGIEEIPRKLQKAVADLNSSTVF